MPNQYTGMYEAMGQFIYQIIIADPTFPIKDVLQNGGNFYPENGQNNMVIMQDQVYFGSPLSAVSERREFYNKEEKQWYEERVSNRNRIMDLYFYGDKGTEWGYDFLNNCDNGIASNWFLYSTPNMGIVGAVSCDPTNIPLDQKLFVDRVVIRCTLSVTSTKVIKLNKIDSVEVETVAII